MGKPGCLPFIFTWANWLVQGLGKEQNSSLENFVLESPAFTICTSQFHSPQKGRERLERTGMKDGFEELEHESSFGIFRQE